MNRDRPAETSTNSLAESVYAQLRDEILMGRLSSGTPLTEKDLVERLSISRTPIREALRHLQEDGLVEIRHGRGAWVKQVSFRDIVEAYEVRWLVEPYAARLAASHHNSECAQRLHEMLNTFREPTLTVDLSRRWQIDAQLHDIILDAAGNSLLRSTIWDLRMRTERAFTYIADQRLEMFRQEHVVLIQTILNGDAVNAERLMREHLEHAKASLTDRRSL